MCSNFRPWWTDNDDSTQHKLALTGHASRKLDRTSVESSLSKNFATPKHTSNCIFDDRFAYNIADRHSVGVSWNTMNGINYDGLPRALIARVRTPVSSCASSNYESAVRAFGGVPARIHPGRIN